jgi:autotransporter-associated beta strand protein
MLSRLFTRRRAGSVMTPVVHQGCRKARRLSYRPQLEALEERLLLFTNTWTGLGGTPFWSNPANWDTGTIPETGDDLVFANASTTNDLTPGMSFRSLSFTNSATIDGNSIVLTGGITGGATINLNSITLGADQSFSGVFIYSAVNCNGFTLSVDNIQFGGPFSANGTIVGGAVFTGFGVITLTGPSRFIANSGFGLQIANLNGFDLILDGTAANSSISGPLAGNGGIIKDGTGTWTLNSDTTYTGPTTINAGTLAVSGTISGSVNVVGGTLKANAPFMMSTGPGLTILGALAFSPGATYEAGQTLVDGSINLNGASLSPTNIGSLPFSILQSPEPITGIFNGLPNGATINGFEVHYFNPSPGFPAQVVLCNDPKATLTTLTLSQTDTTTLNPPLMTATVGAPCGGPKMDGTMLAPPGTVTFLADVTPMTPAGTLLGTLPLINGVASLTPLLLPGLHHITAVFNPADSSFSSSSSQASDVNITAADMGWRDTLTGDFNGDGKPDLAARDTAGHWWVALSTGSSFANGQAWTTWSTGAAWFDVQAGDFNGDGKADIVGRASNGQWWVALSTGSSFNDVLWDTWSSGVTWADVKVGDFNGDGKADIVGRYLQGGTWWVGLSTGLGFSTTQWAAWSTGGTWVDVNVGDFNGDGKADIDGRALENGQWYVGLSNGSTAFNTSLWDIWSTGATWVDVRVGDFNGDGKADITGRWLEGGQWWTDLSNGSAFVSTLWDTWSTSATWINVRVGDFNGDGKADITGQYLEGGSWWTGISASSSFTTTRWASTETLVDVQVGDFTSDGKADITGRVQASGGWLIGVSFGSAFAIGQWTTWPP